MIKAGFASSAPDWHWWRQFPKGQTSWGNVEFRFAGDLSECDLLFVYDAIPKHLCGKISAKKAVFIASEPENVKKYRTDFLSQFDLVLTTDESTTHENKTICQVALPWLAGAWDEQGKLLPRPMAFDDFESLYPVKKKLVSVVSSNKAFTPEHRLRLEFVDKLKQYFGNEIDYFGRNINSFGDKTEVLSEYRYHISLENCYIKNYWTEKLSDAYLTLTYPIYYGCPNINDFFSKDQLTAIDISDERAAIEIIKKTINSDICEKNASDLVSARRSVMNEYNIFAVLSRIANDLDSKNLPGPLTRLNAEDFYKRHRTHLSRSLAQGKRAIQRAIGL